MCKLSNEKKKTISGGSPAMVAWVAIMGMGLLFSSINSIVSTLTQANNSNGSNSSYNYSSRKSSMIRMSAFPSRSSINFWT